MIHVNSTDYRFTHTSVALGKFEGIHLGHQLLLDEAVRLTRRGTRATVFTFDHIPAQVLHGESRYQQVYTRQERRKILEEKGIDILVEHPFTREFASMSPEDFIRGILVGRLGARQIIVGTDFRFGKNRSGDVNTLAYMAYDCDYELKVIDKLKIGGSDVSTSRVREAIGTGEMEEAEKLLGRPFSVEGPVVHGKELGRHLHIPTANIEVAEDKLLPPNGVYVTRVCIGDSSHYGITNIGLRPTVEESERQNVETHIFDFDQMIYDQEIKVELLHFCRPEIRFDSVDDLKEQLDKDIDFGRKYIQNIREE